MAIGFGVFFLLRPLLTGVDFTGEPFAHGDLSLNLIDVLLVVIGVPVAAAVAARIAMRRVQISPLGVTRRVTPPMPRAYRLLPLAAGIAELAYFVAVGTPKGTGAQILAYFSGCFLIMAGLVIAGPWLTMVGSRLMAGRAHRPAALLAGRRLSDNPRAAFRAISGLIIALFATSVSVGVITTIEGNAPSGTGSLGASTLIQQFGGLVGRSVPAPGQTGLAAPAVSDQLLAELTLDPPRARRDPAVCGNPMPPTRCWCRAPSCPTPRGSAAAHREQRSRQSAGTSTSTPSTCQATDHPSPARSGPPPRRLLPSWPA